MHTYIHAYIHTYIHAYIHNYIAILLCCYMAYERNTHGNTHRSPPNDKEFQAIEAAFRMELMLSVGATCFAMK